MPIREVGLVLSEYRPALIDDAFPVTDLLDGLLWRQTVGICLPQFQHQGLGQRGK